MNFFNTFRGRLLLILAFLLVSTLGVQYYLNLNTQQENDERREEQEQTLVAAIILGFLSVTTEDRMVDLVSQPNQTFLDENAKRRVRDIIVIDNNWEIYDSLDPDLLPVETDNDSTNLQQGNSNSQAGNTNTTDGGTVIHKKLSELTDLPPLMEASRLGEDVQYFPNATTAVSKKGDEAHAIPIETSKGRWYVMVLLRNDKTEAAWRAAQPLIFTLGILLVSILITFYLVWRFTRPIANLSNAARRVAEGDLSVRVPDYQRTDEMGRLAERFNEMTSQLEMKRELEGQLQQAEKSAVIGRLGSAIAHEIRNPLNYINLTLDHLRSRFAPAEPEQRETFEKLTSQLKAEVARINQQISDFLNYSRPAKVNPQPIDVRTVIQDSLRIVEVQAAEKNIKIGVIEHENVPKIMGDPEFLRSVFNNLFINALQATDAGCGHLTVKIMPDHSDNFVRVEVADTGDGIPQENLSKIFEPYFSTKETGTGLGLAIVQKVVDIHNGTIDVESATGEGTKFTVRLPKAGEYWSEPPA
jgi:signal transduction histidine kinase